MLIEDRRISMAKAREHIKEYKCQFCNKTMLHGNISKHEFYCYLNPLNRKECPVCKGFIEKYRKNITCSTKCAGELFRRLPHKPNPKAQLGSTSAGYKLTKDLLFRFVINAGHRCFRCGGELTRNDFSIDHITPWLNSQDPKGLFFDLENIAYSHKNCNYKAGRRPWKKGTD